MPSSDVPVANLWPQVSSLLLHTLGWVLLAAVALGAAGYLAGRRSPVFGARLHAVLFGPSGEPEAAARRFLRIAFGLLWIADGLLQAQPSMASAFTADYLPADQGPGWFRATQATLARAWMRHPVTADVATVWVQIGLGVLLLLGGRGLLAKLGAWASIGWALAVWFFGESLGGLLADGAGWLTGAPGAALVYAVAAVGLLLPASWWRDGRAGVLLRRAGAVWFALAAVLTALPGERLWTGSMLARPFADGVATNPSELLRAPISHLETLATRAPHPVNLTVVIVVALLAVALWASGRTWIVASAIAWCLLTWWLAQDFGVLGGTATDPNTALPLALLLGAALPVWQPAGAAPALQATQESEQPRGVSAWRLAAGGAAAALAVGLLAAVPGALAAGIGAPADETAVAANSNGGLVALPGRPLPAFSLLDQRGQRISTPDLRGKVVVLTFLDPVCTSDCPLIGAQLELADRRLGGLARHAEFVALDTNPVFHRRADVAAFTASHHLGDLPNWHFLWGAPARLQALLADFGVSVDVPTIGMIQHSEAVYFADEGGRIDGYLEDGAASELTSTYANQVRDEIQALRG